MFSKTFFSRMKHANDITILTGPNMVDRSKYPLYNGNSLLDKRALSDEINSKSNFITNNEEKNKWLEWRNNNLIKLKPSLSYYSLIDIDKKVANIHLITTSVEGLHQKSGMDSVIELNGNIFNDDSENIPKVRFGDEEISKNIINKAAESAAICEMFILIGVGDLEKDYESIPFLAKGNGCYMVEINDKETNFSRHCNEKFIGDINDFMPKLSIIINKVF